MLKSSSVSIAKNRLRALVVSDRVQCTPSVYDHVCRDLYQTLSKYVELTEDDFQVEINRSQIVIRIAGEETGDHIDLQNHITGKITNSELLHL